MMTGVTSPQRSLIPILANKRRSLCKRPGYAKHDGNLNLTRQASFW